MTEPDGTEPEVVESVDDDGTEPEVLYDPEQDAFLDKAPEGELESAEVDGDAAFVETEVQDDGEDD